MTPRPTSVHNPTDLLLRITRTPGGLHITSPQIPGWAAIARGPIPIAQALQAGFTELACARYAARRGETYDLSAWDVGAEALAASGHTLTPTDVIVVREDLGALRPSGRPPVQRPLAKLPTADRPAGKYVPQHDPFAWTQLPDGRWESPAGGKYGPNTRQVQGMLRRRAELEAAQSAQPTLDDVAS